MTADALLSRLDKVKRTGVDRWIARCPSHDDRRPSLAIRELDDGRLLVHCFAGCGVDAVVAAVGMELQDLFPEKPIEHGKRERRPFPAADVLRALDFESLLVAVAASNLAQGEKMSEVDRARLMLAHQRISEARRLALDEH